jgi:OTU domain-containing protein 3
MSKKKTALAVHHNVSKKEERMNKASWKKQRAREARNYESAEEKKFADSLRNDGFQINIMDGDGNCLFRSISDQLYGDFARHMEIRQNIMDYILQNESHFRLFMEDDEPFEEYMSRMR